MRGENGTAELMKAYETAGFWLAEMINTSIINDVKDGANTSTSHYSPANTWDDTEAVPVSDLRDFARDMLTEGKPYRMTDIFLYENNWYELVDYIAEIDVNEYKQRTVFGTPAVDTDIVSVPMAGNVHMLMSGLSEGQVIGLDARNKVCEMHYYNDPAFSVPSFNYSTIQNGTTVTKTVPNFGLNFYQYTEDNSHDTIVQFWTENKTVVTDDEGVLYSSSGI
jgi:hypothetical protein